MLNPRGIIEQGSLNRKPPQRETECDCQSIQSGSKVDVNLTSKVSMQKHPSQLRKRAHLVEDNADACHDQAKEGDGQPGHQQQLLASRVFPDVGLVNVCKE